MAFTYGFYNSVNHDRKYDAVQMGQIFDGIITDGIYATYLKAMVVKASSNASEVIVQPGRAWFNHTWSYNDADFPVAAPEPEVVLDRIDTLVLDINAEDASRTNSFLWVQGTPTSQIPEPPTLIHTVTHNQYPLCDVYRKAGTTQIYAADITNRVGTSDCPFVTGVLEGINIDDLLAQWDDEFHTWENATKVSFEGWMVNQQSVYTAWWDALKAQMAGDVADVEAWIETIHDILDEEVATRLQAEIDEIKTELPSGSHITVTTTDTELYSRTVTITDEANHTVTSQFDATGVAVFKTVPYVGNLTISSTDGTRTATSVVQTPYFARYQFAIAFWSATVNIDGTSELGGETVSITDSSLALVGTVVLNASGLGVFNATYPDTYKFSVTHGGETMSVTLEVTQETTYNVEIHGGFNWQRWVDLSENYSSSDFNDLDELLADQKAVRELMTIHACVDYLASATRADANITQIINNDICAKWINLRDYALDTLYANSAIAAVMDEADKYFYGEWCLMPQVPKMTSNTAPSGNCFADGTQNFSAINLYLAFDRDDTSYVSNTAWNITTPSECSIGYSFVSSVKCSKAEVLIGSPASGTSVNTNSKYTIQGSTDGTNYEDISEEYDSTTFSTKQSISLDTSTAYRYFRCHFNQQPNIRDGKYDISIVTSIQFYAWQPKGCVPVMTSNTAPYGVASASNVYGSGYEAYRAFDGNDTTRWAGSATPQENTKLFYKFTNPICAKKIQVHTVGAMTITPIASNDGSNWTNLSEGRAFSANEDYTFEVSNTDYYLYYGVNCSNLGGGGSTIYTLQFYGRQLSVSVPKMTSNTAPYGSVVPSIGNNYLGFNGTNSNLVHQNPDLGSSGGVIGYDFGKPVRVKYVTFHDVIINASQYPGTTFTYTARSYTVQGSNDGETWTNIGSGTTSGSAGKQNVATITDDDAYRYYRINISGYTQDANYDGHAYRTQINLIQFYGLDYSEKEFEAGTTKKWLYDHGVELEELTVIVGSSGTKYVEKTDSYIELKSGSVSDSFAAVYHKIDMANYSLVRVKIGDVITVNTSYKALLQVYKTTAMTPIVASRAIESSDLPNNAFLDISNINDEELLTVIAESRYNAPFRVTELWVE